MAAKRPLIWIKTFLTTNATTKAMALVMAVLVWSYAYFSDLSFKEGVRIPLIITAPEGWLVTAKPEDYIIVSLSFPTGSRDLVQQAIDRGTLVVRRHIDEPAGDVDESTITVEIDAEDFDLPQGANVTVRDYSPPQFTVTIARGDAQRLRVKSMIEDPPQGYRYRAKSYSPWPNKVLVKGPKTVLSEATEIETLPITVPPRDNFTLKGEVPLQQYVVVDGESHAVECNEIITFWIDISRVGELREFEGVPVFVLRPLDYPYVAELEGSQVVTVVVEGPETLVDAIEQQHIRAFVDLMGESGLLEPTETAYPQTVQTIIQEALGTSDLHTSVDPPFVGVTISKREEAEVPR